jgi:O-antigen ligase
MWRCIYQAYAEKIKFITKNYRNFKKDVLFFTPFLCLVVLAINLTRIYFVALLIGILASFRKGVWKNWLGYSLASFLIFIISFVGLNLLVSQGKSYGLELLGLKIHSIARPSIEESSLSRLLLLPKIEEKIKNHPLLGSGLGTTITVYSPVLKKDVTTPHFDWGYLEILTELGLIGLGAWLALLGYIIKKIVQTNDDTKRGFLVSTATLLIINITSPALFHVLGIVWIVMIASYAPSITPTVSSSSKLQPLT